MRDRWICMPNHRFLSCLQRSWRLSLRAPSPLFVPYRRHDSSRVPVLLLFSLPFNNSPHSVGALAIHNVSNVFNGVTLKEKKVIERSAAQKDAKGRKLKPSCREAVSNCFSLLFSKTPPSDVQQSCF